MAKSKKVQTFEVTHAWRKVRPDLDATAFSIMLHLIRMGVIAAQNATRTAARHGINGADARLLMMLRGHRDSLPLRPSELSERLDLSRATITYRIERLLAKGMVESSSDAADGRALNVRLTPRGREVIDTMMTDINAADAKILAEVDAVCGNQPQFEQFLTTLVARWERTYD